MIAIVHFVTIIGEKRAHNARLPFADIVLCPFVKDNNIVEMYILWFLQNQTKLANSAHSAKASNREI